MTGLLQWPG